MLHRIETSEKRKISTCEGTEAKDVNPGWLRSETKGVSGPAIRKSVHRDRGGRWAYLFFFFGLSWSEPLWGREEANWLCVCLKIGQALTTSWVYINSLVCTLKSRVDCAELEKRLVWSEMEASQLNLLGWFLFLHLSVIECVRLPFYTHILYYTHCLQLVDHIQIGLTLSLSSTTQLIAP